MGRHLPGNLPIGGHGGRGSLSPPAPFLVRGGPFNWGVCAFEARVRWCGGGVCVCLEQMSGESEYLWSSGRISVHGHACQRDRSLGLQEEEKPLLRYNFGVCVLVCLFRGITLCKLYEVDILEKK